jgi:hypothetical protein
MRQEDIGSLKKSTKAKIIEEKVIKQHGESRDYCIKLTKVGVLPSDQRHSRQGSKTLPSETLMKDEDSGNRSRVGGARLSVYSKAPGRTLSLGFMSKGV